MKHVVVGIISRKNSEGADEYLLVSARKDFGEFTGAYYPPGGHVEDGENEGEALAREIQEELGLKAAVKEKIAETPGDVADQTTHWYACEIDDAPMKIDEQELASWGWFTQRQMEELKLWPATKNFFNSYIHNKDGNL